MVKKTKLRVVSALSSDPTPFRSRSKVGRNRGRSPTLGRLPDLIGLWGTGVFEATVSSTRDSREEFFSFIYLFLFLITTRNP